MKKIKETKNEYIIFRVTEEEKLELKDLAKDSKNISNYIRHKLGLDD